MRPLRLVMAACSLMIFSGCELLGGPWTLDECELDTDGGYAVVCNRLGDPVNIGGPQFPFIFQLRADDIVYEYDNFLHHNLVGVSGTVNDAEFDIVIGSLPTHPYESHAVCSDPVNHDHLDPECHY